MNDVTKILKEAKSLIANESDWFQGSLIANSGCMCALGAIAIASGLCADKNELLEISTQADTESIYTGLRYNPAVNKLADAIGKHRFNSVETVYRFNDDSSHSQVMEMFDKAIEN